MKYIPIILILISTIFCMVMLGQALIASFDSKQFIQNHLDLNTRMVLLRAGINV